MAGNRTYAIGEGWKGILAHAGVNSLDVLRRAALPADLLNRDNVELTPESFFRFFEALDAQVDDSSFWVRLTEAMSPEYFTPPMFAALCSPDLATAAERLSRFKPLMGPITLDVRSGGDGLELTYRWKEGSGTQPAYIHGMEAMFVTRLARLGTRQRVCPSEVIVPELPRDPQPFEDYLGIPMKRGELIRVRFASSDAQRPFLTASRAMWSIFEPELGKRLADLEGDATFADRTRAVLMEALPSGQLGMATVARHLGVSSRTLQRRLRSEDTSFKALVDATRESLARHYLGRTHLSATEIAFLLGFDEPTSFFRAFQRWTGTTPETVRRQLVGQPIPSA
ncbi:MAG: AraC family transcriptional regulator ligand-binding domain-containing protein [Deltaproteobacteria bacterium]|nr:AraC family transcriptional regulator ligand-binding domain-containing protein [Deltaproteobacteria bacterium]